MSSHSPSKAALARPHLQLEQLGPLDLPPFESDNNDMTSDHDFYPYPEPSCPPPPAELESDSEMAMSMSASSPQLSHERPKRAPADLPARPTSPLSLEFNREQLDDPRDVLARPLPESEQRQRLNKMFSRAASNGDMYRIADMLDHFRDWIDIDSQDEDGTTPLIYAACFGHVEIAFMILEAGAVVDGRDKFGWTALVWATNNKHDSLVRLLLENGASTSMQTKKGHTIVDFLRHDPNDNTKIVEIFQEPRRRYSVSSCGSALRNWSPSMTTDEAEMRSQPEIDRLDEIMAENERRYRMAMESATTMTFDLGGLSRDDDQLSQIEDEGEFDWDRCLPDQMFVFSSKSIAHIVNTTIISMDPSHARTHKPVPASVLFLAARFAHYFSTPDLLDELLGAAFAAIDAVAKSRPDDMNLIAYWISNTTTLIHFLRKDPGLAEASGLFRSKFEGLVQDLIQMLVIDAENRIEEILEHAMLEHDTVVGLGLDDVKFQSDWAFLWRGGSISRGMTTMAGRMEKRASLPMPMLSTIAPRLLKRTSSLRLSKNQSRPSLPHQRVISPRTLTAILSSLLFVLRSHEVHRDMIYHVISQIFYFITWEIFNRMMSNKKLLSRTKALQTRHNLSILEDWIRNNQLPFTLAEQFGPLVQLLQLLQILSMQEDFATWIETLKKLELLNPIQVKRVVNAYRFEVNEPRLPEELTQYVLQVASDTEKMVRRQSLVGTLPPTPTTTISARRLSRPLTMFFDPSSSEYSSTSSTRRNSQCTDSTRSSLSGSEGGVTLAGSRYASTTALGMTSEDMEERPMVQRSRWSFNGASMAFATEMTMGRTSAGQARSRPSISEDQISLLSETKDSRSRLLFSIPENLSVFADGSDRELIPAIPEEMMSTLDTYAY
ncbi:hypothetical protein BGW38_000473 [Lunasporangiospora selenospora]|uniref:Dilute domain-containing protein n=1 Tax=Lunasporangiospora selenospora TaxID=979761 RepID=A0A9P6FVM2_9FUNG|nr:hypothetical protein BGW38_000473 [Lunasporangiospora selenospora]